MKSPSLILMLLVQLFLSCNNSDNNKKALFEISEKYKEIVKNHENEVREKIHENLDSVRVKLHFYEKIFDVCRVDEDEQNKLSNLIYLRSTVIDSMLIDYDRINLIASRCEKINRDYSDKFASFTDSIIKVYDIDYESLESIKDSLKGYFSNEIVKPEIYRNSIYLSWENL